MAQRGGDNNLQRRPLPLPPSVETIKDRLRANWSSRSPDILDYSNNTSGAAVRSPLIAAKSAPVATAPLDIEETDYGLPSPSVVPGIGAMMIAHMYSANDDDFDDSALEFSSYPSQPKNNQTTPQQQQPSNRNRTPSPPRFLPPPPPPVGVSDSNSLRQPGGAQVVDPIVSSSRKPQSPPQPSSTKPQTQQPKKSSSSKPPVIIPTRSDSHAYSPNDVVKRFDSHARILAAAAGLTTASRNRAASSPQEPGLARRGLRDRSETFGSPSPSSRDRRGEIVGSPSTRERSETFGSTSSSTRERSGALGSPSNNRERSETFGTISSASRRPVGYGTLRPSGNSPRTEDIKSKANNLKSGSTLPKNFSLSELKQLAMEVGMEDDEVDMEKGVPNRSRQEVSGPSRITPRSESANQSSSSSSSSTKAEDKALPPPPKPNENQSPSPPKQKKGPIVLYNAEVEELPTEPTPSNVLLDSLASVQIPAIPTVDISQLPTITMPSLPTNLFNISSSQKPESEFQQSKSPILSDSDSDDEIDEGFSASKPDGVVIPPRNASRDAVTKPSGSNERSRSRKGPPQLNQLKIAQKPHKEPRESFVVPELRAPNQVEIVKQSARQANKRNSVLRRNNSDPELTKENPNSLPFSRADIPKRKASRAGQDSSNRRPPNQSTNAPPPPRRNNFQAMTLKPGDLRRRADTVTQDAQPLRDQDRFNTLQTNRLKPALKPSRNPTREEIEAADAAEQEVQQRERELLEQVRQKLLEENTLRLGRRRSKSADASMNELLPLPGLPDVGEDTLLSVEGVVNKDLTLLISVPAHISFQELRQTFEKELNQQQRSSRASISIVDTIKRVDEDSNMITVGDDEDWALCAAEAVGSRVTLFLEIE